MDYLFTKKKRRFFSFTLFLVSSFLFSHVDAIANNHTDQNAIVSSQQISKSGYFGKTLILGVDQAQKTVTGYYENYTGWDEQAQAPRFSCIFYLQGKLEDNIYKIKSWHPEQDDVIEGQLTFALENEQLTANVRLQEEHGGCWNVQNFATQNGASFPLQETGDWNSVQIVTAEKAFFHSTPHSTSKTDSYVIKGDVLKVFQTENEWLKVEFGKEKTTQGWLKKSLLLSSD